MVEFDVSKLSVAFVDVSSFVHNNSTRTLVSGFYNYILSLFKLAYGLSFRSAKVIMNSEGWFGQPKYSTPSKNHPTLCRFLLLYTLRLLCEADYMRSLVIQRIPAGSSFRLRA